MTSHSFVRWVSLVCAGFPGMVLAATITWNFTAPINTGPFNGQSATGSFQYTDSAITGTGIEVLTPNQSLLVDFFFQGQHFTEANDANFADSPVLTLTDGTPSSFSYQILDLYEQSGGSPRLFVVDIADPRIHELEIPASALVVDGAQHLIAPINIFLKPVPVPTAWLLLLLPLGLALNTHRASMRCWLPKGM